MENIEFNRVKVIQDMQELKMKKLEEIKAKRISSGEITIDEESLSQTITVKYLGKIELVGEYGEKIERDWYAIIEKVNDSESQITYYDENQQFLGIQKVIDEVYGEIIPSQSMMWERPDEMTNITKEDIKQAKTKEDLEQKEEEKVEGILPGLEEQEMRLTKAEVDRMSGPMTFLNQEIEGVTLANAIDGLTGAYIKFVNADEIRRMFPNAKIPGNQRTVPLEVFPDGSANIIGDDKLAVSQQEGTNSNREHTVVNEDGQMETQQMMETFKIVNKGDRDMQELSISYDENGGKPLEIKYGWRNPNNETTKVTLENVNSGRVTDDNTRDFQKDTSAGTNKPTVVSEEDAQKLARTKGYYTENQEGKTILDVERAIKEILEDGRPVAEIIETYEQEDAKVPGPGVDPRRG